jgi:hypothetical protein
MTEGRGLRDHADRSGWTEFLAGRRELHLLEWMVVYGKWTAAGDALSGANAPRWVRVAEWATRHPDSHTREAARLALEKRAAPREAAALPPLTPEEVLAALDAPETLEELGDRKRAEPGKRDLSGADMERIRARLKDRSPARVAGALPRMLERAAWADLGCHPLEHTLVPWTLRAVRAGAEAPEVRAALEQVRDAYATPHDDAHRRIEARVRSYARRVIEGDTDDGPRLR